MVIKEIEALIVDDDKIGGAEDDQVNRLEGRDHHLIDGTGDEDEEHAVGEVLGEVGGWFVFCAAQCAVVLPSVNYSHTRQHHCSRSVDIVAEVNE